MQEVKGNDVGEDLIRRLNAMLERITEVSENQLRLLNEEIKELHDRRQGSD